MQIRAAALSLGPELKLGGNGPVIAKRMVEEGAEVLLAIQNEKVRIISRKLTSISTTIYHVNFGILLN